MSSDVAQRSGARQDASARRPLYYRPGEVLVQTQQPEVLRPRLSEVLEEVTASSSARCVVAMQELLRCSFPARISVPKVEKALRAAVGDAGQLSENLVMTGQPFYHGGPGGNPKPAAAPPVRSGSAGAGVRIAVLDTGGSWRESDYDASAYVMTRDYLPDTSDGHHFAVPEADDILDRQAGHGIFIGDIIQQIAPAATVEHHAVLNPDGVTDVADLARALTQLESVHIVNLSLGGYSEDDKPPPVLVTALRNLRARNPGVVVVAAVDGEGGSRPFWPAALPGVVSVGSLRQDGSPAVRHPAWVDACAVGEGVVARYLTGTAGAAMDLAGRGAYSSWGSVADVGWTTFDGAASWSGTSFAAPQVSAAIAERASLLGRGRVGPGDLARAEKQVVPARVEGCPRVSTRVAVSAPPAPSGWRVQTVAGVGPLTDRGLATRFPMDAQGLTVGGDGMLYVASRGRIYRVDPATGAFSAVLGAVRPGDGSWYPVTDGAPAAAARSSTTRMFATHSGDVYWTESNGRSCTGADLLLVPAPDDEQPECSGGVNRVMKVDVQTGRVSTVAGTELGFAGDGQDAREARLEGVSGIAATSDGDVFLATGHRIRKIDGPTGVITTIAGDGRAGSGTDGDGGDARLASLNPGSLTADDEGDLFFTDSGRLRRVDARTGAVHAVPVPDLYVSSVHAGTDDAFYLTARELTSEGSGSLGLHLYRMQPGTGAVDAVASWTGFEGDPDWDWDDEPAFHHFAVQDADTAFAVSPADPYRVMRLDLQSDTATVIAGNGRALDPTVPAGGFGGDAGPALEALLDNPTSIATNRRTGDAYVADSANQRIRRVAADGSISTVLEHAAAVALAMDEHRQMLYFADPSCICVRGLDLTTREVQRVAGIETQPPSDGCDVDSCGSKEDSEPDLAECELEGLCVDEEPAADPAPCEDDGSCTGKEGGHDRSALPVETDGDGGPALEAHLGAVTGIAVDADGDLYISAHRAVRRVDASTGVITTVAGDPLALGGARRSEDVPAVSVPLDPSALAVHPDGDLLIADAGALRRVDVVSGHITTIAGHGRHSEPGYEGPAKEAGSLGAVRGVAVSKTGEVYIAAGSRVRAITADTASMQRLAGDTAGFSGDGGDAGTANFWAIGGLAVDAQGNLLVADSGNHRVRLLTHP